MDEFDRVASFGKGTRVWQVCACVGTSSVSPGEQFQWFPRPDFPDSAGGATFLNRRKIR